MRRIKLYLLMSLWLIVGAKPAIAQKWMTITYNDQNNVKNIPFQKVRIKLGMKPLLFPKDYYVFFSEEPDGKESGYYAANSVRGFVLNGSKKNKITIENMTKTNDGWYEYDFGRTLYICRVGLFVTYDEFHNPIQILAINPSGEDVPNSANANAMFDAMVNTVLNNSDSNNASSGNSDATKKKKEEESALLIKELCPDDKHPHAIDLGIGVKFACCNVGASEPWHNGNYYSWGDNYSITQSNWDSYKYKHINRQTGDYINIGNNIAGTKYDIAHVTWGSRWRMPTISQLRLLKEKCEHKLVIINDKNCVKFTGPNGKSIVLPFTGGYLMVGYGNVSCGYYWSSTINTVKLDYNASINSHANCFTFTDDYRNGKFVLESLYTRSFWRDFAFPIRPILGN